MHIYIVVGNSNTDGIHFACIDPQAWYCEQQNYTKALVASPRLPGTYLKRFWLRGILPLVAPALTIYYFIIWKLWIAKTIAPIGIFYGPDGAPLVYCSWFIFGVITFNLHKYGFVGAQRGGC